MVQDKPKPESAQDEAQATWDEAQRQAERESELEARLEELAALPLGEYDRQRKGAADELGWRVSTLDTEVEQRREKMRKAKADDAEPKGHSLSWPEIKPWPEPVDGAALLDDMAVHLQRFAIMPSTETAIAVVLWALHCHVLDAAIHTPRLLIVSPTEECGKGQVIGWLSGVVPRPYDVLDPTGPTLFRPIELYCPTVLIDEGDLISWDQRSDLLQVINGGHTRTSQGVPRCVGDEKDVRLFRVWAPLAYALIIKSSTPLPRPTLSRSIMIRMQRKARDQTVEHRRIDRDQGHEQLRRKCARWAQDNLLALKDADPDLPVDGRCSDVWRAIIAIADRVGGEWPQKARNAALTLSAKDPTDESMGVQLLADIEQTFDRSEDKVIWTEDLLAELHKMNERPWAEYGYRREQLSVMQLAQLLKPFEIVSQQIKREGRNKKGYRRRQFEAAWERYLPAEDAEKE